jgi:predicted PurR-regulated permease PerM
MSEPPVQPHHDRTPSRLLTPVGLFVALAVAYFLFEIRFVVVLVLVALLYATIIERPVRALERRRIPRRAAVLLLELALVAAVIIPALLIAPAAGRELNHFRKDEPASLRQTEASWATSSNAILRGPGRRGLHRIIAAIETPSSSSTRTTKTAVRGLRILLGGLACLIMAYYYLAEKDLLRELALDAVPRTQRDRCNRLWDDVERVIGGWLRSRLLLGPIAGAVSLVAFALLRLPYWPLLGLLTVLTEPIPIIGPWIGGVPAVFMALTISWQRALVVVAFILLRQFTIDTTVVPRLTQRELGMSPLTVFVAVLAGTELFGPIGALLAIPLAATVQVIVADVLAQRRAAGQDPFAATWRWLRGAGP